MPWPLRLGRDGFWLARWPRARGIEAYVIHATSIAVSREHRRAKTDRLDTELLKRAFIGWPRGEPNHCSMVPIPSLEAACCDDCHWAFCENSQEKSAVSWPDCVVVEV